MDYNLLTGIDVDSSGTGLWVVGYHGATRYNSVTNGIIMHWNGTQWDLAQEVLGKFAATAASKVSTQARAVGSSAIKEQAFASRWMNDHWQTDRPQVYTSTTLLAASYVPSSNESFSVGNTYLNPGIGQTSYSDAFYNDGQVDANGDTHWVDLNSSASDPSGSEQVYLNGVKAFSGSDAWVVGAYRVDSHGSYRTLIKHYSN